MRNLQHQRRRPARRAKREGQAAAVDRYRTASRSLFDYITLKKRWVEVQRSGMYSEVWLVQFALGALQCELTAIYYYSYPTHVWSPAGGWYAQPSNWKFNTFVIGSTALGLAALLFNYSAQHEHRDKFPEPGRFFPSRWYVCVFYLRKRNETAI